MKRLGLLVMPLMAASFLTGCAQPTPTPVVDVVHTIHLDPAGGTIASDTILTNLRDGYPVEVAPTISKDGYDALEVKWYTEPDGGGQEFTFGSSGTPVTKDYFLHAKWGAISQFTVNFYNDDGTLYDSLKDIKIKYGDKVTYKDCPTDSIYDEHYKFDGWYNKKPSETGAELFSFDTPLIGNPKNPISIYAKHSKKTYHVTFDANGGEITSSGERSGAPLDITYNNSISEDKCPTASRSGYSDTTTWCTDKAGLNVFTFDTTPITNHTTLYAKWGSPVPTTTYTVTLDAGDGTYSTGDTFSVEVESGTKLSPLLRSMETPILDNKVFAYYKYNEKEDLISYDDRVTSDVILEAQYFDASKIKLDTLDFTWDEIKQVAVTNKYPSSCFKIGATKTVTINEKNHSVRIIDFRHEGDVNTNGDQTGITFEFANIITKSDGTTDLVYWNDKDGIHSTNYKYSDSSLNDYLNVGANSIFNKLPDDLKAEGIIEEVYKPVEESPTETSVYRINDSYATKLFPLSFREITESGIEEYAKEEGTTYAFYMGSGGDTDTNRIKSAVDSRAYPYWLRSPCTYNNSGAWSIQAGGNLYRLEYVHSDTPVVAPAFCI